MEPLVMIAVDMQRTPALGICVDCEGPSPVNQAGRCETCGSDSVIRPFSLASQLRKVRPFTPPAKAHRVDKYWKVS